jgi:hypothetical protein
MTIMFLIIVAALVVLFLIASVCPIWTIKWKYVNKSKATVDPSGNIDTCNIPKGWMCAENNGDILWSLLFGRFNTGKSMQSHTWVYSRGSNIKYKIGIFYL